MFKTIRDNLEDAIKFWHEEDYVTDEDMMTCMETLSRDVHSVKEFKLYRYTPANYHSIRNLETQQIHLSEGSVMNDVYEGLPAKDIELCKPDDIRNLENMARFVSFSEKKDNLLMWGHYADSSKGICVEYDLTNLELTDDVFHHLFPILYSQKRYLLHDVEKLTKAIPELEEAILRESDYSGCLKLDDLLPLFVIKSSDWEYESEWRIVYTLKQLYDENRLQLYKGNIPFKCVSAIYLGYRTPPEVRRHILEIAERLSKAENRLIKVYQAKLIDEEYRLEFDLVQEV